jgi:antitoxin component of MazEF toxin-antitoxin module
MQAEVGKLASSGHSTVLAISRRVLARLGWKKGDAVAVMVEDGELRIARASAERLRELFVQRQRVER